MRRRSLIRGGTTALLSSVAGPLPAAIAQTEAVDLELILAVDLSRSVDADEQDLQVRGYAEAFRDRAVIDGIAGGIIGAAGCMMFVWSDWDLQEIVVPWTRLDGRSSCFAFAEAIERIPRRNYLYTSISGALDFTALQFGRVFSGTRRVVDISGDGVNNSGRSLETARADALARGTIINGLAVLDRTPGPAPLRAEVALDDYYRDEVIGGPGSFLVVAEGFEAFGDAVRRKIIREIAAAPGPQVERWA